MWLLSDNICSTKYSLKENNNWGPSHDPCSTPPNQTSPVSVSVTMETKTQLP